MRRTQRYRVLAIVLGAVIGAIPPGVCWAHGRRFAFSHQVPKSAPGHWVYEQWVTWRASKGEDSTFDQLDFKHEVKVTLSEQWHLGIIPALWRYQDGRSVDDDGVEFLALGAELIYTVMNPKTDPLGLALLGETKIGDELFVLEGKLIAEKDLGPWILVYNLTLEAEWEGSDYEEDHGVLEQTFGASYRVVPGLRVGAELVHEIEFEDWNETGDDVVYLGPNFSYRGTTWGVAVTPGFQVTDVDAEADFMTRMIFEIEF